MVESENTVARMELTMSTAVKTEVLESSVVKTEPRIKTVVKMEEKVLKFKYLILVIINVKS